MEHICSICEEDPRSHSFISLGKESDIQLFYSCPWVATHFDDNKGMLIHIDNALDYYQCDKIKWRWIFDADRLNTFQEMMKIRILFKALDLIETKYCDSLNSIHIVNANWYIRYLLKMVLVFSNRKRAQMIRIIDTPIHLQSYNDDEMNPFIARPFSRQNSMEFSGHLY